MSQRLAECFQNARREKRTLFCPFLTAGYPRMEFLPRMLLALQESGAGCVEMGFPFSDPIADGPVIQESYRVALERGATVEKIIGAVRHARESGLRIPLLAMASFSILFRYGTEDFAEACAYAGVDGLILPDLPLEEAPPVVRTIGIRGLAASLLIAPGTDPARRARIAELCTGFVYYLSVSGITGERSALPPDIVSNLAQLRKLTDRPVCVGFGISQPRQVRSLRGLADGVIVGSAIIRRLTEESARPEPDYAQAVREFSSALAVELRKNEPGNGQSQYTR
jgi:tryptophan synthase alpha chain